MERSTLVRLLVVLAIGIPLVLEAATFAGLFDSRVLDGGPATETPTATPGAPPADAVGVGDELLPATPQRETVTAASVGREDGARTFRLTVAVENDAESSYELRLDALTTDRGKTVTGGGRTEQLPPGANTTLTGRWELAPGEDPRAVIVVATLTSPAGERETVTRRVTLAAVEET